MNIDLRPNPVMAIPFLAAILGFTIVYLHDKPETPNKQESAADRVAAVNKYAKDCIANGGTFRVEQAAGERGVIEPRVRLLCTISGIEIEMARMPGHVRTLPGQPT